MRPKYINPFTDFGFKKIFGEEASTPILMDFLNALLPLEAPIKEISFRNPEQLGRAKWDRRSVYDIYCENERGKKFIVELQKENKDFFVDRIIYYSTFPIAEWAQKGDWNFNLKSVFCIGILDFVFKDYERESERNEIIHFIKLKDQHCRVFYDKLTYIYLQMPNFRKKEEELVSSLDKWLYFIKNLEDFESIPRIFKGEVVFEQALERAAVANFDEWDWDDYRGSLKKFWDRNNELSYAIRGKKEGIERGMQEGREAGRKESVKEGREEGWIKGMLEGEEEGRIAGRVELRLEMAKKLKAHGDALDIISKSTGIVREQLSEL